MNQLSRLAAALALVLTIVLVAPDGQAPLIRHGPTTPTPQETTPTARSTNSTSTPQPCPPVDETPQIGSRTRV